MPRPLRASPGRILAAAAAEFSARGFAGARVDRIAAAARVNKAMLYYHFGSKSALYTEVLREMFRAVAGRARAIVDGRGSPTRKLDAWIVAIVGEASARPWFPPIMLRELGSGAPHLDPDTLRIMDGVYGSMRDLIVEGQRAGVFRAADPLLTHLTIMPAVLLFFARQRALRTGLTPGPGITAARNQDDFVRHMKGVARRMLRKD